MNINTFEDYIPEYLLERGYTYYLDNLVYEFREIEPNFYTCIVEGTNDYEVTVEINHNGDIIYADCDCPHQVEVCKHLVAVFYKIKDYINNKPKITKYDNDDLKTLLQKQDKETLVNTIMQLISEDISMKESLIFRFNDKIDYQVAKNLLLNVANEIEDYEEPTERHIDKLNNVVADIDYKVGHFIKNKNYIKALEITFLILDTYARLNSNIENYDFFEEYYEAVATIENIIESILKSNKLDEIKFIFNLLLKKYENTENEVIKEELINIFVYFTKLTDYRNFIEQIIKNYFEDYFEGWLNTQIRIHQLNNETDEIIKLASLNLEYSSMREYLIHKNLEAKDYKKVLELAIEGELLEEEEYKKWHWQGFQLSAYKGLGDIDKQKDILNKCFIDGKFDLKNDIKSLYSEKEWPQHIELLLEKISESKSNHYIVTQIAKEEGLKHILFKECLYNPYIIISNYKYLLPEYKDKIEDIFLTYYNEQRKFMNKRCHYRNVANIIWNFYTIYGTEKTLPLINELKILYPRRTALIEEINKVLKKMII